MSTCKENEELLAAWADGGLEGAEAKRVEQHLAGCVACRGEVESIRGLLTSVRARPVPQKDEKFWTDFTRDVRLAYDRSPPRVSFFRWPAVMAGLALAICAVLIVALRTPHPAARRQDKAAQTTPAPMAKHHEMPVVDEEDLNDDELEDAIALLDSDDEDDTPAPTPTVNASDDDDDDASITTDANDDIENLSDDEVARVYAELDKT